MHLLLQRYLAANFLLPLIVSTLFLVLFLLTFDMFRLTGLLMSREIGAIFILELILDIALTFIPLSLPLAAFFSMIFCLGKMSSDSEYIALRAAGMSKGKILLPFLLMAVFVAITTNIIAENITPYTNRDFRKKIQFLTSSGIISEIREGQFFTYIRNFTLFASTVADKGEKLGKVFIKIDEPQNVQRVIFAEKGALIYQRNPETLIESLKLELYQGNMVTIKPDSQEVDKILFDSYYLPIKQSKFSTRITPKETMLNRQELHEVIKMPLEEAEKRYRFDKRDMFNAKFEYWNRKNASVLVMLFTFLGFSLGIKENRGKGKNNALRALIILITYYAVYFALISLARSEKIPIQLAMSIPLFLLLVTGARLFQKLDWQS